MKNITLFTRNHTFVSEVVVHVDCPEYSGFVILYKDKLYKYDSKVSMYLELDLIVADEIGETEGKCNIPNIGRKDKCLKCTKDIDPKYGVRYCEAHQIGICFEHSMVNCQHCGYNKKGG